jgi:LysM repeat protein
MFFNNSQVWTLCSAVFLRENPGAKMKQNKPQKNNRKQRVNMNTPSPLVPQGATPPRAKSSLYFKILMVLSVHVVVIGGMLLQGCKDTSAKDSVTKQDSLSSPTSDTTAVTATAPSPAPAPAPAQADVPPTVNPNISNAYAGTAVTAAPTQPAPAPITTVVQTPKSTDLNPPAAPGEAKEYVIAKGDTLAAIAHKNGLSVKALMEANPGVDAKKLQIGHKLQVPAGTPAVAATPAPGASAGAMADAAPAEGSVYVVKSGDMLLKIAKAHSTTVKKIMALNDLKSTSIRAGQKLKLPSPKTSAVDAAAASTAASASVVPAQPVRVSATAPATVSPVAAN